MTHGQIVTLADVRGLTDPNHWLGQWANRGFGKDAVQGVVGTWTHYVVDSAHDTNGDGTAGFRTLRHALTQTASYFITFVDALGDATTTLGSDIAAQPNKFIDARRVKFKIAGARVVKHTASNTPGTFGTVNVIYDNGTTGTDVLALVGITGTGRQYVLALKNTFQPPGAVDDPFDLTDPPTLGLYLSAFQNHFGTNDGTRMERGPVLGNNRSDQNTKHSRWTWGRNVFENTAGSYVRQRQPLFNDGHMEHYENLVQWGLAGIQPRNSDKDATGPTPVVETAILRSRWDVFDRQYREASGNEHDGISISNRAWVRVENAIKSNDGAAASFTLDENNRSAVTDAAIYVDEAGGSLATYNDYTPGADLTGLSEAEAEALIKEGAGWCDTVTLGGTLGGADDSELDGKTITATTKIHNWPALTTAQKTTLLDSFESTGDGWTTIRNELDSGDVAVSGKTVTITIPNGVSALVTLADNESISLVAPGSLFTASSETGAEETLTITPAAEPAPPPLVFRYPASRGGLVRALA